MQLLTYKLYHAAIAADKLYSKALKTQFGTDYRWEREHKDYSSATWDAYTDKVNADAAWLNYQRVNR